MWANTTVAKSGNADTRGALQMGKSFRKEIVRTIRRKVWTCCRNARLSGKVHSFRKGWEPLEAMRYYRRTGRKYQGEDTRVGSAEIHGGAFDRVARFMR